MPAPLPGLCDLSTGKCPRCGYRGQSNWRHQCQSSSAFVWSRCVRRRMVRREEHCNSCAGNIRVKVYGCILHGECALSALIPGVQDCQVCPDAALAITRASG